MIEEKHLPEYWQTMYGYRIVDADGWVYAGVPWSTPITQQEFEDLSALSTIDIAGFTRDIMRSPSNLKEPAMATDTAPTTDVVVLDAEDLDTTDSFGKEIVKTTATTAATAAIVLVGVVTYNKLKPIVVAKFHRAKNVTEEVKEQVAEKTPAETTPKPKKD